MKQVFRTGAALSTVMALGLALAQARVADYGGKSEEWFRLPEGLRVTRSVLSWQTSQGSWPKNLDTSRNAFSGDREKLQGTFDNGATTGELRFLARAFGATKDGQCEQAFLKGLDHILKAQYPSGGWPQYFPPPNQYPRRITFNDDTMVRLMQFLREVGEFSQYDFVDARRRAETRASFDKGIDCILKCQITTNGRLAAWCAQHDEIDFQPRPGRSYELPSISGAESAGILELLMSLDNPRPEVIRAVHAGVGWFESVTVTGLRIAVVDGGKRAVTDPGAPPIWARFYDLESGRPFFSDRDGIKRFDFNELGRERRNGYAWYGDWGLKVARRYSEWVKMFDRETPKQASGTSK